MAAAAGSATLLSQRLLVGRQESGAEQRQRRRDGERKGQKCKSRVAAGKTGRDEMRASGLLVAAEVGRAASCWPSNIHFVNIWLSFSLAIFLLLDLESPLPRINKNHAVFHGNMISAGTR